MQFGQRSQHNFNRSTYRTILYKAKECDLAFLRLYFLHKFDILLVINQGGGDAFENRL